MIRRPRGSRSNEDTDSDAYCCGSDSSAAEYEDEGIDSRTWDHNLRRKISECLQETWNFECRFATGKTYVDAPNPVLEIYSDRADDIGLPVGKRDAQRLVDVVLSRPAEDSKAASGALNGVYELNNSEIKTCSLTWKQFLVSSVRELSSELNFNFKTIQPRCSCRGITVYQHESTFSYEASTQKTDAFAVLLAVLPSRHSGGTIRVMHEGKIQEFPEEGRHRSTTTLIIAYLGTKLEVLPVTEGSCVVLQYELINTTSSLHPALSQETEFQEELLPLLSKWMENAGTSFPSKLVYLLQEKYPRSKLCFNRLKAADAATVTALRAAVTQLDLHIGLATIRHHTRRCCGSDGEGSCDDCGMESLSEVTKLVRLVDMDGTVIANRFPFRDAEDVTENMVAIVASRKRHKKHVGDYRARGALHYWWHASVVVIWPASQDFLVRHAGVSVDEACEKIIASAATASLQETSSLVEFALARCDQKPNLVAQSIAQSAISRKDSALWVRAMHAVAKALGLRVFSTYEPIWDAVLAFGFSSIQHGINSLLCAEKSQSRKLTFLEFIANRISGHQSTNLESQSRVGSWVDFELDNVFKSLYLTKKTEFDEECRQILESAIARRGMEKVWESTVSPMLTTATPEYLCGVVGHLATETQFRDLSDKDSRIQTLLTAGISGIALKKYHPGSGRWLNSGQECVKNFKALFDTCVRHHDKLCGALLLRTAGLFSDAQSFSPSVHLEVERDILRPALLYISETASGWIEVSLSSQVDFLNGLEAFVPPVFQGLSSTPPRMRQNPTLYITGLLHVAKWEGGWDFLLRLVLTSTVEKFQLSIVEYASLAEAVHAVIVRVPPGSDVLPKVLVVLGVVTGNYVSHPDVSKSTCALCDAVDCCLRIKAYPAIKLLFTDVLTTARIYTKRLATILLPALPKLTQLTREHSAFEVMGPAFQAILLEWVNQKPTATSTPKPPVTCPPLPPPSWTCTCSECKRLIRFLRSPFDNKTTFRGLKAQKKPHLDKFLRESGYLADLKITTLNVKSKGDELQIVKSQRLLDLLRENNHLPAANATTVQAAVPDAAQILQTLGTDQEVLRPLLGEHYSEIMTALGLVDSDNTPSSSNPRKTKAPSDLDDETPANKKQKTES